MSFSRKFWGNFFSNNKTLFSLKKNYSPYQEHGTSHGCCWTDTSMSLCVSNHDDIPVSLKPQALLSHPVISQLTDIPSITLVRRPNQCRVTGGVKRCSLRGHAHHCMCAPLPFGPFDLPHVEPARVSDLSADTVGALRNGVPVKSELVFVFHEYVQRSVVGIPGMGLLGVLIGHRTAHETVESLGSEQIVHSAHLEIDNEYFYQFEVISYQQPRESHKNRFITSIFWHF